MKTLSVSFNAPSVKIPFGYHHQVQSLIYNILRQGGEDKLHDGGFGCYKLFTFSQLRGGRANAADKSVCFESAAYLDIRSVSDEFCRCLLNGLQANRELKLFGQPLSVRSVEVNEKVITDNRLSIKMLSPLTVHLTAENGFTEYLNPLDADFHDRINRNFERKYFAFFGENPAGEISLNPIAVGSRDKCITLYKKAARQNEKDIYIEAWKGKYELSGKPKHLNFLYYCGLGEKNSSGFGMFEPM